MGLKCTNFSKHLLGGHLTKF